MGRRKVGWEGGGGKDEGGARGVLAGGGRSCSSSTGSAAPPPTTAPEADAPGPPSLGQEPDSGSDYRWCEDGEVDEGK